MSVTRIPLARDLQGMWGDIQIDLATLGPTAIPDIYPFISVTDLKRLIWIQQGGEPRWAPERVFLGVRSAAGVRPLDFHWPLSVTGSIDLPDPMTMDRAPNPALVDEAGNRRPIAPTMVGSLLLETALSPEFLQDPTVFPSIVAIPLVAMAPPEGEVLTSAFFHGFYQLYFPWLTAQGQVLSAASPSEELTKAYAAALLYTEDRTGRFEVVQAALSKGVAGSSVAMNTMVKLRWTLPPPSVRPDSLEHTFYSLHASVTIPFLRFFPAGGKSAPLMKLALKADGSPLIDNDKILTQFLNTPAPAMTSGIIQARIPLLSKHVDAAAAFTLYMFEDGTSDITLDVPQRGMTYIAAAADDTQRILQDLLPLLGYPAGTQPMLREIHATYKWTHPAPQRSAPLTAARLQSRVDALTPFFDVLPPAVKDEKALANFKWRAVSNYESEGARFAYISYLVNRGGDIIGAGKSVVLAMIAKRFGLSVGAATVVLDDWLENYGSAVAPAAGSSAGSLAVAQHSAGASIAISGSHPEYMIEIQQVDSYADLQRILSVIGMVLGSSSVDLSITAPTKEIESVATSVAIVDAATVEASNSSASSSSATDVEFGEMDPALAAILGGLGYNMDDEGEGEGEGEGAGSQDSGPSLEEIVSNSSASSAAAAVAATLPAPNLEAAVAAVDEECGSNRWIAGEAPLSSLDDYYVEKLSRLDKTMFGYTAKESLKGRSKTYSKTCQRSDGRQPNIMTLEEYARVKRCYQDRVRFVDLPPRKPSDLPQDPGYSMKKARNDDYFLTDPTPGPTMGFPIWSVYGYSKKTPPGGEYLYLMCVELWCERDNLPLLRSEFEANGERCPFCDGAVINDMKRPRFGESVIVRKPKGGTGKLHQYVGQITRVLHPEGYSLPCCDTTPRLLKVYMEAAARGTLKYGQEILVKEDEEGAEKPEGEEAPEPAPELALELTTGEERNTDYSRILGSMQTQYLLGNDKVLTDPGKIALLSPALDNFFGQRSMTMIKRDGIRQTFGDRATLFVRLSVDVHTRARGLNLFAGLSPFLAALNPAAGITSAESCQRYLLSLKMIRAFEAANYGTLVQEFAARSDMTTAEITGSLPTFAKDYGYRLDTNRAHVIRLYKAWIAFLQYLADTKQPKQLRHLEHLLAQPGTISRDGLLLVVLEPRNERIEVVCPSFGIPKESIFSDVPVAFLYHDPADESWEPLVLYNGSREAVRFFGSRSAELNVLAPSLQQGLKQWLADWRSSSRGCGRPQPPPHVWTPDRDTNDLPRLTRLRARIENAVASIQVRDRSNRLAGVLFTVKAATPYQLFVPCLDDGTLATSMPRVFEADSIPPVGIDAYLRFYGELATRFPGLRPVAALFRAIEGGENQIVGFRTAVGSIIPTAPSPLGSAGGLPEEQVDQFPWERDALVLKSPDTTGPMGAILEESTVSVEEQLAEAYQHVRLTLSRWLQRDARGPTILSEIRGLIRSTLPLYEKRKRMDILLGDLLHNWIFVERTDQRKPLAILRQDCLSLDGTACEAAGACKWIPATSSSSASSSSSSGRCLIHAPTRGEESSVIRIFTARLSDELLRYGTERKEILDTDSHVSEIRSPKGVVRIGDELFLAAKQKEGASAILRRLGFTGEVAIQFPEEMLRFDGLEEEGEEPVGVAAALGFEAEIAEGLPAPWLAAGYQIPNPPPEVEDARRLAWAEGTGKTSEQWEDFVQKRRAKLALPGDPMRPFQWSVQDFYAVAAITLSNVVFLHADATGTLVIDRWIQPPGSAVKQDQLFILLWGSRQLLVTKTASYRFKERDLPEDLRAALAASAPMSEEEAKGYVNQPVLAEVVPTLAAAASAAYEAPSNSASASAYVPPTFSEVDLPPSNSAAESKVELLPATAED